MNDWDIFEKKTIGIVREVIASAVRSYFDYGSMYLVGVGLGVTISVTITPVYTPIFTELDV